MTMYKKDYSKATLQQLLALNMLTYIARYN